ncbi:hypothetical protein Ctob_011401 [Chrysochromulina tobinii]|uniref:Uncharacterized protein n=1 Tax=Chrysochromulina tobinii TaxID=1460289 RepID=A0A0M0K2Y5_9EUKA|nr:hypothetical protein Ctob_011401 [Chrysochromulina tobinii]|eukprot:KOO32753.1 hypothetical protein Ctob_011401 [Chrysochromulina sp. CCMP291]
MALSVTSKRAAQTLCTRKAAALLLDSVVAEGNVTAPTLPPTGLKTGLPARSRWMRCEQQIHMKHAATTATTMAMTAPTESTSLISPSDRFCAITCGAAVISVTVTGTPAIWSTCSSDAALWKRPPGAVRPTAADTAATGVGYTISTAMFTDAAVTEMITQSTGTPACAAKAARITAWRAAV